MTSFDQKLKEFEFNYETFELLKNENCKKKEILETMHEVGLENNLTELLINNNKTDKQKH